MITPTSARSPPSASSSALTHGSFADARRLPEIGLVEARRRTSATPVTISSERVAGSEAPAGGIAALDFSTISSHPPHLSGRLHVVYLPPRQGVLSTPLPSTSHTFDVAHRHRTGDAEDDKGDEEECVAKLG